MAPLHIDRGMRPFCYARSGTATAHGRLRRRASSRRADDRLPDALAARRRAAVHVALAGELARRCPQRVAERRRRSSTRAAPGGSSSASSASTAAPRHVAPAERADQRERLRRAARGSRRAAPGSSAAASAARYVAVEPGPVAQRRGARLGQEVERDDRVQPVRRAAPRPRRRCPRRGRATRSGAPPAAPASSAATTVGRPAAQRVLHDGLVEAGHGEQRRVVVQPQPAAVDLHDLLRRGALGLRREGDREAGPAQAIPTDAEIARDLVVGELRARPRGRSRRSSPAARSPGSGSPSGRARAATRARPAAGETPCAAAAAATGPCVVGAAGLADAAERRPGQERDPALRAERDLALAHRRGEVERELVLHGDDVDDVERLLELLHARVGDARPSGPCPRPGARGTRRSTPRRARRDRGGGTGRGRSGRSRARAASASHAARMCSGRPSIGHAWPSRGWPPLVATSTPSRRPRAPWRSGARRGPCRRRRRRTRRRCRSGSRRRRARRGSCGSPGPRRAGPRARAASRRGRSGRPRRRRACGSGRGVVIHWLPAPPITRSARPRAPRRRAAPCRTAGAACRRCVRSVKSTRATSRGSTKCVSFGGWRPANGEASRRERRRAGRPTRVSSASVKPVPTRPA